MSETQETVTKWQEETFGTSASRLQTRCGGRVVTVIPTAKEDRLKQRKVAIP